MSTKVTDGGFVDNITGEVKAYSDENGGFATWDEFLGKLKKKGLRPDGTEVGDPVPMEPPIGYVKPPDLMESIRMMVRSELLRRAAVEEDFETLEEAEDFDVEELGGDSWETLTPYEQAELEGMSARKHGEAAAAEGMTTPANEPPNTPPVPPVVVPKAPEPASAGSAASSSVSPSGQVPQGGFVRP